MRLSHGFVRGEVLSCIYHGWSFAQNGQCARIPAHPSLEPPATIRASSYPVVESDGIIWAAASAPSGQPPGLDGRVPLRSMIFDAGAKTIEAAAGAAADRNGVIVPQDRADVALLLAPRDDRLTLVHVLVAGTADAVARIAASREVESLRRKAEALQHEGATP